MNDNDFTTQEAMKELGILSPNTLKDRARKAGVKPVKGYIDGTEVVINIWTQEMIDAIKKFRDPRPHPSGFTVERTEKKSIKGDVSFPQKTKDKK